MNDMAEKPKTGKFTHYIRWPRAAPTTSWTPATIAAAYQFPKIDAGAPQTIGILELGGGYRKADIVAAFTAWGLPVPTITDVGVDGGTNTPGGDADGEVVLDIEWSAAPYSWITGKPANLRVYFAPNTDAGFLHAFQQASADGCSVISISWGGPEDSQGPSIPAFDATAQAAAAKGVTTLAASGDNDSGDGESGAHVDFPASSPHIIGCGGTRKTAAAETVWNNGNGEGTGGGYSAVFPTQAWQLGAPPGPGRMVPDIAANADPQTGYQVYINGSWTVIGGTSAVAPLYAGVLAAINGALVAAGKPLLGFCAPRFFQLAGAFTDITVGNNGAYSAQVGPDPCTGRGVLIGGKLLAGLMGDVVPPPPPPPVGTVTGPTLAQVQVALVKAHAQTLARINPYYHNIVSQLIPYIEHDEAANLAPLWASRVAVSPDAGVSNMSRVNPSNVLVGVEPNAEHFRAAHVALTEANAAIAAGATANFDWGKLLQTLLPILQTILAGLGKTNPVPPLVG